MNMEDTVRFISATFVLKLKIARDSTFFVNLFQVLNSLAGKLHSMSEIPCQKILWQ